MSDNNPTRILSSILHPAPAGAGDQAILNRDPRARLAEMTYGGALSFLRRPYSRDLSAAKAVVCGVPYDGATSNRPGARLGPRAIRAASAELGSSDSFPYGGNPFSVLPAIDWGDLYIEPQLPHRVAAEIEAGASELVEHDASVEVDDVIEFSVRARRQQPRQPMHHAFVKQCVQFIEEPEGPAHRRQHAVFDHRSKQAGGLGNRRLA